MMLPCEALRVDEGDTGHASLEKVSLVRGRDWVDPNCEGLDAPMGLLKDGESLGEKGEDEGFGECQAEVETSE